MVTPAGKEMLKNTINTVKLHNRILEENEMWRHWNMQKGLTMMVSDGLIRKEKRLSDLLKKTKKKKKKHKEKRARDKREMRHPKSDSVRSVRLSPDRWDHSGFEELYPESKPAVKNDSSELKRSFNEVTKKCKPGSSNTSPSTDSDSSDSKEIWEEFKLFKKRRHKNSSDKAAKPRKYDSDVHQDSAKRHKADEKTFKKREYCKKCESRHCHVKHERKATKHVSSKHS